MENDYITEHGENETRDGGRSGTAGGAKSRKKQKPPIDPALLLRVLSQAAYDVENSHECHEQGISITYFQMKDEVVIRVRGTQLSHEQIIVPRMKGE